MHVAVVPLFVAIDEGRDADQFPALVGEGFQTPLVHLLIDAGLCFGRENRQHFHGRVSGNIGPQPLADKECDRGKSDQEEGGAAFHLEL